MDAQTTTAPDGPPPRSLPHRMHRPPKPARARGHQTGPAERAAIVGIAIAAAVVAAFAPGQPTRYVVADVVVRAGVAALVTLAASRARRWTWLVLAGLAAVVAGCHGPPRVGERVRSARSAGARVGRNGSYDESPGDVSVHVGRCVVLVRP